MDRECELEHFGFTAEHSSLERKYFLQKILRNALDAMLNKFNVNEETSELLRNAKEEVFKNIWMSMSDDIEAASNLDIKYFTIPEHVLLPPYFDHVKQYTEQNEQELDAKLDMLKKSFLENSIMLASLNLENSQYKHFSTFVDSEVKIQEQLKDALNSVNMKQLHELVDKTSNLNTNDSHLVDKTKNLKL